MRLPYTYQAKVFLENGPLTAREVIHLSGWPPSRVYKTLQNLAITKVACMVNLGGTRPKYALV